MENRAVAEGHPPADGLGVAGRCMNNGPFLFGRSVSEDNAAVIAADNGAMADIAAVANDDIST